MQKAGSIEILNLPHMHFASYAGIIRIRFQGLELRFALSQPGIPSSPFSIVIIVSGKGNVKFAPPHLNPSYKRPYSAPLFICLSKRKRSEASFDHCA